ncbi:MAG: hypothetical protein ACFFAI_14455 [Promethearchaeota archaeon]
MESPIDNGTSQEKIEIPKKKKKDPVEQFFLQVKKDFNEDLKKIKASWDKMIKNLKENSPKRKRFRKLYGKLEEMEGQLSEIKDDTTEIKLKIDHVAKIIDKQSESIADIETYMKKNLGSDWKILKNSWKQCKKGEISKIEFFKISLSKIGKRFASIFISV